LSLLDLILKTKWRKDRMQPYEKSVTDFAGLRKQLVSRLSPPIDTLPRSPLVKRTAPPVTQPRRRPIRSTAITPQT
jgi:hypothetical protein